MKEERLLDRRQVLIVDDDGIWRNILRDILSTAGFDCQLASTRDEALSLLLFRSFDLLILDHELSGPNIDDATVILMKLKEKGIKLSTVIVTGHGTVSRVRNALKQWGVFDVFDKNTVTTHPVDFTRVAIAAADSRVGGRGRKAASEETAVTGKAKVLDGLSKPIVLILVLAIIFSGSLWLVIEASRRAFSDWVFLVALTGCLILLLALVFVVLGMLGILKNTQLERLFARLFDRFPKE